MRATLMFLAIACLASCADANETESKPAETPETEAPKAALPGTMGEGWRQVHPDNLVIITTHFGDIYLELNDQFAPRHADRFRDMVKQRTYNGARFYRVIDGFVAQGGLNDRIDTGKWPNLVNENERDITPETPFEPLGNDDLFAPLVGHVSGFAVGRNPETNKEWLLHCPGAMAMARDTDPDSGGTEFYIALAPQRYLDRNLTVFARVLSGMEYVQKLQRGDPKVNSGVISEPEKRDKILSMKMASELDEGQRPVFEVMDPQSMAFSRAKSAKRNRKGDFFYNTPPAVIDVCGFETPTEQLNR